MPLWLQHLLVILLIATCLALLARQAFRFYRGRSTGSCCSTGCTPKPLPTEPTEHFLPRYFLTRRP